jgi:hypothetical protein
MGIVLGILALGGTLWRIFSEVNSMKEELRLEIRNVV